MILYEFLNSRKISAASSLWVMISSVALSSSTREGSIPCIRKRRLCVLSLTCGSENVQWLMIEFGSGNRNMSFVFISVKRAFSSCCRWSL